MAVVLDLVGLQQMVSGLLNFFHAQLMPEYAVSRL